MNEMLSETHPIQAEAASPQPVHPTGKAIPADGLAILPTRNLVLFPGVVLPLTIGRPSTIAAAQQAVREERPVGLLLQRDPGQDDPAPGDA